MKFDPFAWQEVPANEEVTFGKGRLRLRLSARAPLYVSAQGVESLVGIDENHEVHVSEEVIFRVDGPVRAFMFVPEPTSFEPTGEVFTNCDRMPMESGSVAEVTRAMRVFELERRAALAEIRKEADELRAMRAKPRKDVAADAADARPIVTDKTTEPRAQPIDDGEREAETVVDEDEAEPAPAPAPASKGKGSK